MPTTHAKRLVYLGSRGVLTRTHDGDVVNIGGISTTGTFTLNNKPLLFADGSSTGGPGTGGITLQSVYNNSIDAQGNGSIKLLTGKDFAIYDDTNDNVFFKVDAETGKITITGDLEVLGSASIINSDVQTADHWVVSPSSSTVKAFVIEPDAGVIPTVNLVDITNLYGGNSVFSITPSGKTILDSLDVNSNVYVGGLINGVDIVALANTVLAHISSSQQLKHTATEIAVDTLTLTPNAVNVQEALEGFQQVIQQVSSAASLVKAYEFIQPTPALVWTVSHNQNTKRIHYTLWDEADETVWPDYIKQIDENNMEIYFGAEQTGRLVLMCF